MIRSQSSHTCRGTCTKERILQNEIPFYADATLLNIISLAGGKIASKFIAPRLYAVLFIAVSVMVTIHWAIIRLALLAPGQPSDFCGACQPSQKEMVKSTDNKAKQNVTTFEQGHSFEEFL